MQCKCVLVFVASLDTGLYIIIAGDTNLSDCLAFFTGVRQIPPVGLDDWCTLNFSSSSIYPTAAVCALTLTLPSKYDNYDDFKQQMNYAIANHGGFGLY
jgi:hypothetical protein